MSATVTQTAADLVSFAHACGIRLAYLNGKLWARPNANEIIPFRRSEFRAMLTTRLGIPIVTKETSRTLNHAIDILIADAPYTVERPMLPDFALFLLETDADGRAILGYLNQAGGFKGRLAVLYDRLRVVTREFCGRLAGRFTPTFLGFARKLRILMPLFKSVGIDLAFSHKEDGNHVEFQIDKTLFNPEPIASLPGGCQSVAATFSRKCKFYLNLAYRHVLRVAARLNLTAESLVSLGWVVEAALSTPEDHFGPPLASRRPPGRPETIPTRHFPLTIIPTCRMGIARGASTGTECPFGNLRKSQTSILSLAHTVKTPSILAPKWGSTPGRWPSTVRISPSACRRTAEPA
jgi:hypothetical protein